MSRPLPQPWDLWSPHAETGSQALDKAGDRPALHRPASGPSPVKGGCWDRVGSSAKSEAQKLCKGSKLRLTPSATPMLPMCPPRAQPSPASSPLTAQDRAPGVGKVPPPDVGAPSEHRDPRCWPPAGPLWLLRACVISVLPSVREREQLVLPMATFEKGKERSGEIVWAWGTAVQRSSGRDTPVGPMARGEEGGLLASGCGTGAGDTTAEDDGAGSGRRLPGQGQALGKTECAGQCGLCGEHWIWLCPQRPLAQRQTDCFPPSPPPPSRLALLSY